MVVSDSVGVLVTVGDGFPVAPWVVGALPGSGAAGGVVVAHPAAITDTRAATAM
jgi:hypothetical protein